MALTKEQEELYKNTMEEAKNQLIEIDERMEKEIQKIREKLAELQKSKKVFRQIYEGAAKLLGIEIEPGIEEEEKGKKDKEASEESFHSPS